MRLKRLKVRKALRDYPLIGVRIKHIQKEIALRQKELDMITAATSSYGEIGGRSLSQDSPVERMTERREKAKGRIDLLLMEVEKLTWEKERIDEVLELTTPEERDIITRIYINGESPVKVAGDVGYSDSYLTKHISKALDDIAFVLFGI